MNQLNHKLTYRLTTRSPVIISSNTGDQNMTASMDYIPGNMMLGIIAWKYIKEKKLVDAHIDECFYDLFLNSSVIFSNAYIVTKVNHNEKSCFPVPLSLQSLKDKDSVAYDKLLLQEEKPDCLLINGYCYQGGSSISRVSLVKSLNFHHANTDRIKGHSSDGEIFNYESIDAGQVFKGTIKGSNENLKAIKSLLEDTGSLVRLGRSKRVQYGKAEVEIISLEKQEESTSFQSGQHFILNLLSPAIIYNQNGFPSTLQEDFITNLACCLTVSKEDIKILKYFQSVVDVESFVSVWRLKKPVETALKAGSSYLIKIENINGDVVKKLGMLENSGIGERRSEGFGQIKLTQQENQFEEKEYAIKEYEFNKEKHRSKPELPIPIPRLAQYILNTVILSSLRKDYITDALLKIKDFDKLPTSSLLGRLEMILSESGTINDFKTSLSSLNETAKKQLEKIRKGDGSSLYNYLQDYKADLSSSVNNSTELQEIVAITGDDVTKDTKLEFELYKLFLSTFFKMMRKMNKENNGNGGGNG